MPSFSDLIAMLRVKSRWAFLLAACRVDLANARWPVHCDGHCSCRAAAIAAPLRLATWPIAMSQQHWALKNANGTKRMMVYGTTRMGCIFERSMMGK